MPGTRLRVRHAAGGRQEGRDSIPLALWQGHSGRCAVSEGREARQQGTPRRGSRGPPQQPGGTCPEEPGFPPPLSLLNLRACCAGLGCCLSREQPPQVGIAFPLPHIPLLVPWILQPCQVAMNVSKHPSPFLYPLPPSGPDMRRPDPVPTTLCLALV